MKSGDLLKQPEHVIVQTLRRLLCYNPETGALSWNARTLDDVPSKTHSAAVRWNKRYAGKLALTAKNNTGYMTGAVWKTPMVAHVVAWIIATGRVPAGEIDHIDGNKCNNALKNLREVTPQENNRNRAISPTANTSGIMGVSYCKRDKLWVAHIGGKASKYFKQKSDAIAARKAAEAELGYHANHGRKLVS